MAADFNWLQVSAATFLNRADLYPQIPTFVTLAEARLNRQLRVRRAVSRAQATIGAEFETVPPDFAAPISMTLTDDTILDCVAADAMAFSKSREGAKTGKPCAYAVVGGAFEFDRAPDQSYQALLIYYAQLAALSASNPTNWLIAAAPDAYLYGVLCEAAPYLGEDGRIPIWEARLAAALAEISQADRAESYGARLTPSSPYVV